MLNRHTLLSTIAISCMFAGSATADLILGTDFEGTTPIGDALNGVTWNSDFGITSSSTVVPTNSTGTFRPLFATSDTAGYLALDVNIAPSIWFSGFTFTTQNEQLDIEDLELTWASFDSFGDSDNAPQNHTVTVAILDAGVSIDSITKLVGGPGGISTGLNGPQTETFDLSATLLPTTTYDLFFAFGSQGGTNIGVDAFSLNSVAVPEPGPLPLVGLGLLCMISVRRRRRSVC